MIDELPPSTRDARIIYSLTTVERGARSFHGADLNGVVLNIMSHVR